MIVAAVLLGILLAVIVASRPATTKVLFSAQLKIIIALLCSIFGAYIFFMVTRVAATGPYIIWEVLGSVVIVVVCVVIGNEIRKRKGREKKHSESK